ncbi:MAG: EAL domain-containing protein [Polyangiaceae bacterium]|nr:EAL domain-containing protein [Polyangiaceae bacterium]
MPKATGIRARLFEDFALIASHRALRYTVQVVPESNAPRRRWDSQDLPSVHAGGAEPEVVRSPASVLVVDDDPLARAGLGRVLAAAGYSVREAANAEVALAMLSEAPCDVALVDVNMPGMDGVELLRRIRAQDPKTGVAIITGEPSFGSAADSAESGAVAYLVKPVTNERLLAVVGRASRFSRMVRLQARAGELARGLEDGLPESSGRHVLFERALRSLWLARQPIVNAADNGLFGYEVLMRNEEPALLHPSDVLGLAERLGRTRDVGRAVRRRASRCVAELPTDLVLFVNLHASELADPELMDPSAPLSAWASRVVFEVAERARLESIVDPSQTAIRLRSRGFRLALDDLGAGFAGLNNLPVLEPEFVKVDMALVRGIDASTPKQRIFSGIVTLAHELSMKVISEGVETEAERAVLCNLGSDLLQGYLIGRPGRPPREPGGS